MRGRIAALALLLSLLCTACVPGEGREKEGQYSIYFLNAQGRRDDAALGREFRETQDGEGTVEGLMALLLAGPESDELRSPFPRGTVLRSCGVTDGVAAIDLSEAYEGLSGAGLTLADGCIVFTLCQLEGVDSVYLTVEGHPRPFRDQVLSPQDFLLDNGSGGNMQPLDEK